MNFHNLKIIRKKDLAVESPCDIDFGFSCIACNLNEQILSMNKRELHRLQKEYCVPSTVKFGLVDFKL
jgi:hypothetical protein